MAKKDNGDNFFTEEEIKEQVDLLKKLHEEREANDPSKGFTIMCNNCKEKIVLSKHIDMEGSIDTGSREHEVIKLTCKCGNVYSEERWGGYIPN